MTDSFVYPVPHLFQASIFQIKSAAASAAAVAMKLSIKSFMEEHKDSYPCSTVPCTRQGHCPKWLPAASKNKKGLVLRKTGYCVIKTSCLSHDDVHIVISGDGIPLPVEFGEVVDGLETWGGIHWTCWLEKSLQLMHEHMREDNMHGGIGPTKMRLFHDCILLAIQWKAGCRFCTNSPECNLVLSNWNTHHWVRCRETCSFHQLARDSMDCVAEMIQSVDRDGPVTMAFQSVELARLSSVHCVPESPTSVSTYAGESTEE